MDRTQGLLAGIAIALFGVTVFLVTPFLEFFLLAVLLAYVLRPLQDRLAERSSHRIAAASLVLGSTVAVILPVLVVLRIALREATVLLAQVRRGEITFARIEAQIVELTGIEVDLAETIREGARQVGTGVLDNIFDLFGTVTHLVVGVGLTVFLLYYFLKDAARFNRWVRSTTPLPDDVIDELLAEFDDIMRAVLAGHVLVAIIQGILAGIGLVAVGIPNAVFWTMVMVVLAVIPVIGSFMVWGPAAIYLVTAGRPVAGVALFVYGTVVVGLSDDYLRPIVVDRYARLNPSVVIVGILGGIYLIGVMGIFFGPIIIGSLRATLDVYRRRYVTGTSANAME